MNVHHAEHVDSQCFLSVRCFLHTRLTISPKLGIVVDTSWKKTGTVSVHRARSLPAWYPSARLERHSEHDIR